MDLNGIEMKILMQRAMQPTTPKKSAAFYKRRQRDKAATDRMTVGAPVTSETMDAAVLDALAEIVQSGDPDGIAASIIQHASSGFRCPTQAEIRIGNRLKKRSQKVLVNRLS